MITHILVDILNRQQAVIWFGWWLVSKLVAAHCWNQWLPAVLSILILSMQLIHHILPQIYFVPMFMLLHPTNTANSVPFLDCMSTNFNSIMHSLCFTSTFKIATRMLILYKNLYISYAHNVHHQLRMSSSRIDYLLQLCMCKMFPADFVSWRIVVFVANEWPLTRIISGVTCVKWITTWNV